MRTSRIIDKLTGKGNVARGGEVICEVDYEIIVSQPIANDIENPLDPPGTPSSRGRLRVLDGKRNLMNGDLTLQLDDGRNWEFTVTNGNLVSALYMAVQSGGDSLAPEMPQA